MNRESVPNSLCAGGKRCLEDEADSHTLSDEHRECITAARVLMRWIRGNLWRGGVGESVLGSKKGCAKVMVEVAAALAVVGSGGVRASTNSIRYDEVYLQMWNPRSPEGTCRL